VREGDFYGIQLRAMVGETAGAEGGVDRIVHRAFFAEGGPGGVFVDVGAAKPDYLSVSALFRAQKWRVISIEPNPEFCRLHAERGFEVLQYACGSRDEDDVPFQVVDSHGIAYEQGQVSFESFSSLGIKPEYAALKRSPDVREIKVKLRRLDTVLQAHAPDVERIDILSVDVEGWELEVLDGLDMVRHRPRVIILENLFNARRYRLYLERRGFMLWKRVYPNDVYVSSELVPRHAARLLLCLYGLITYFGR
jgi:FkbM family methyltransferase